MTLIIGIRSKDGVVIGTDRKVIRGGEAEYTNKLYEVDNVVYAIEGLTGVADDFHYLFNLELRRRRGVDTLYEMKLLAEDIIAELTQRYAERTREVVPIGVLMAGLDNITSGRALLYYIHGVGYGETTRFRCSGHGGPYATSIAKFLLKEEFTVEENAKRVAFIIAYIAEDVDTTVGGEPMVAMIHDSETKKGKPIKYLGEDVIKKMIEKAKETKCKLNELLQFSS